MLFYKILRNESKNFHTLNIKFPRSNFYCLNNGNYCELEVALFQWNLTNNEIMSAFRYQPWWIKANKCWLVALLHLIIVMQTEFECVRLIHELLKNQQQTKRKKEKKRYKSATSSFQSFHNSRLRALFIIIYFGSISWFIHMRQEVPFKKKAALSQQLNISHRKLAS